VSSENIDLPLGRYELVFSKLGYQSQSFAVDVTEHESLVIDLTLIPLSWRTGDVFADVLLDQSLGPRMVAITPGSFVQGDSVGDGDWRELPTREVSIKRAFAIGESEVTVADFRRFAQAVHRVGEPVGEDDMPITHVSWHDAVAYTEWLSAQTAEVYRLPTESEWEFAARAGSHLNYGIGELNCDTARFGVPYLCSDEGIARVKSYPPNPFGLYDMQGNVWEWTLDCAAEDYTDAPVDGSAFIEENCQRSTLRGGAYMINAHKTRVSYRSWRYRDYSNGDTGFRVVKAL
jgi:formylglycine-generating enzyme required for sulfatase activity